MRADTLWQLESVSLAPARLRGITIAIPRGVTAVLGWSGAGKTSLLNLLAGFEKPDAGTIAGAERVAWVPQNGGLWPHCTAREHLEIARRAGEGISELLAEFDLTEKAASRPDELSEGEQSRLAVARALAAPSEVLVMDEPLVHVDPARIGKYWRAIREHTARTNASLVFATHEAGIALGEAAHVVCLREGRALHAGPVGELYANPPTEELMEFLGAGNWLTPEDARHWLGIEIADARCFRPEQVAIEPCASGRFVVDAARFCGSVAEVQLRSERSAGRPFFHRPATGRLHAGMSVKIGVRV